MKRKRYDVKIISRNKKEEKSGKTLANMILKDYMRGQEEKNDEKCRTL